MTIDWDVLNKAMFPIQNYQDLSQRWKESFAYSFAREHFNFSMTAMAHYTLKLLGGDTKQRYTEWMDGLISTFRRLDEVGVRDVLDLLERVWDETKFEGFIEQSRMNPKQVIGILTYLVYWFIPTKKSPSELFKSDPVYLEAMRKLRLADVRTNLDLLEQGNTPQKRRELAERSGVPLEVVTDLVHRADFSRLPWTSRATISNYIGSGYKSLAQLAGTPLEQVSADFYRYGASIHKNFKLGSEIDNAHRVAVIVPKIVDG